MNRMGRLIAGSLATALVAMGPDANADAVAVHRALSPDLEKTIAPGVIVASDAVLARALKLAPVEEDITLCTTPQNATRVVKIRIKNNFRVKSIERDVVSKKVAGGDVRIVNEPPLGPESTKYDLLLNSNVWGNDNIIAVKVFIRDNRLHFWSNEQSITTVKSPVGTSMFICLDPIKVVEDKPNNTQDDESDTSATKWNMVTFYVDRTKKRTQKFNIRVIVDDDDNNHVLPIIIDPNIKNEG